MRVLCLLWLAFLFVEPARAAEPLRLKEGDRVVWLGSTLIEREQKYGFWETALTTRFPAVTFRNLAWSGDTVRGEARASFEFGKPAIAFKRLVEGTLSLKPTVLLIAYGTNESFEGEAGLAKFGTDLERLLDALAPAKARTILLAPPRHEDLGRPLPDPTSANRNLRLYGDTLRAIAAKRQLGFVDLFAVTAEAGKSAPLTDNGMHLTAYGYWRSVLGLEQSLGLEPRRWRLTKDAAKGLVFTHTDEALPAPPLPKDIPAGATFGEAERLLTVKNLAKGKYTLRIEGQAIVTASAEEWAAGVSLEKGPDVEQAEALRTKIVEKNREYFHRWRPQNETYLFGFRKHEQGQNAREVPLFEPLVEEKEKEIAKLRIPKERRYELIAVRD